MRDWTTRMGTGVGTVLAAALLTVAPGDALRAQEEPEPEEADERCVCVTVPDAERIRERIRVRIGHGARLGIVLGEDGRDVDGVPVEEVIDDAPADEAGLRGGDVIVSFGGHRLTEPLPDAEEENDLDDDRPRPPQRLVALVRGHEPGDEVEVTYRRAGEERTAQVELDAIRRAWSLSGSRAPRIRSLRRGRGPGHFDARPPDPPMPPEARRMLHRRRMAPGELDIEVEAAPRPHGGSWAEGCEPRRRFAANCVAGMDVRSLNPGLGEYFGTDEGVLVLEIADGARLDLQAGDVILAVDGRDVRDVGDLRRILRSYEEGEELRVRVRRDGREIEVEESM